MSEGLIRKDKRYIGDPQQRINDGARRVISELTKELESLINWFTPLKKGCELEFGYLAVDHLNKELKKIDETVDRINLCIARAEPIDKFEDVKVINYELIREKSKFNIAPVDIGKRAKYLCVLEIYIMERVDKIKEVISNIRALLKEETGKKKIEISTKDLFINLMSVKNMVDSVSMWMETLKMKKLGDSAKSLNKELNMVHHTVSSFVRDCDSFIQSQAKGGEKLFEFVHRTLLYKNLDKMIAELHGLQFHFAGQNYTSIKERVSFVSPNFQELRLSMRGGEVEKDLGVGESSDDEPQDSDEDVVLENSGQGDSILQDSGVVQEDATSQNVEFSISKDDEKTLKMRKLKETAQSLMKEFHMLHYTVSSFVRDCDSFIKSQAKGVDKLFDLVHRVLLYRKLNEMIKELHGLRLHFAGRNYTSIKEWGSFVPTSVEELHLSMRGGEVEKDFEGEKENVGCSKNKCEEGDSHTSPIDNKMQGYISFVPDELKKHALESEELNSSIGNNIVSVNSVGKKEDDKQSSNNEEYVKFIDDERVFVQQSRDNLRQDQYIMALQCDVKEMNEKLHDSELEREAIQADIVKLWEKVKMQKSIVDQKIEECELWKGQLQNAKKFSDAALAEKDRLLQSKDMQIDMLQRKIDSLLVENLERIDMSEKDLVQEKCELLEEKDIQIEMLRIAIIESHSINENKEKEINDLQRTIHKLNRENSILLQKVAQSNQPDEEKRGDEYDVDKTRETTEVFASSEIQNPNVSRHVSPPSLMNNVVREGAYGCDKQTLEQFI